MDAPPGVDWPTRRTIDALENIAAELEQLRMLKEHELGVRIEHDPDHGPYIPTQPDEE